MKQIICQKPHELEMVRTDSPKSSPGEVLVRIKCVGICGTDIHAFRGNQPFLSYPRVLGHELSGFVDDLGEGVDGFQKGDKVTILPYIECGICIACRSGKTNCCTHMKVRGVHQDGGMAEWLSVSPHHLVMVNNLSLEEAAMIEPLSIGAHAVRRAAIQTGEHVLVVGAGPIGLGVIMFAKQAGAKVIAMDVDPERLSFCQSWAAADEVVTAGKAALKQIIRLTDGDLPTAVFDATGNAQSMMQAFQYAAHSGRVIYVGLSKGTLTFDNPEFHKKELTLLSSRNALRSDFECVREFLEQGHADMRRFITHHLDFNEAATQFPHLLNDKQRMIKAVIYL